MFRLSNRLMDTANGGDGGGAPAGGADTAAGAGGAPDTVLAGGKEGGGAANQWEFVPEKFRVTKEDGTFDTEASLRKIVEPYTHLEKRFGAGDLPPKEAKDYVINVPESLKDKIDPAKMATDEKFQEYAAKLHAAGLTQAQFDLAVGSNLELATEIAGALAGDTAQATKEQCTAELRKAWATDEQFKTGVRDSYRGLVGAVGAERGEALIAKYGNDPDFVLAWAAIGKEMQEDRAPNTSGGGMPQGEDINALMVSDAYLNPKNPEHAKVSAQVKAHFEKKHGKTLAL